MKVISLASWAGHEFSFAHGALIDMPDNIAAARIAAGLMREPAADELSAPSAIFPGYEPEPVEAEALPTPQPPRQARAPRGPRHAKS